MTLDIKKILADKYLVKFYHDELRFFSELTLYNYSSDKPPLDLNSTFLDIEAHFNKKKEILNEFDKRAKVAPERSVFIEWWIRHMENTVLRIDTQGMGEENTLAIETYDVYENITFGVNKSLWEYARGYYHNDEEISSIQEFLEAIATGVALAYIIPEIKKETKSSIYSHKSHEDNNVLLPTHKLKWKGTPGEFGAIMSELINNGFLNKIRDLKNTVRILNSVFEIRSDTGETVKDDYLYKCFSEKKKNYYRGELIIPESDNYKKEK